MLTCEHAKMRASGARGKISSLDGTDDGGSGGGSDEVMETQRDEDKVQDSKSKSGRGEIFERVLLARICMRNELQASQFRSRA